MAIFNSYVKLPEGTSHELANLLIYSPGLASHIAIPKNGPTPIHIHPRHAAVGSEAHGFLAPDRGECITILYKWNGTENGDAG